MTTRETGTSDTGPEVERPLVRILRGGQPAPDELAALTAVLLARAATVEAEAEAEDEESVRVVPLWERPAPAAPYRSPVSWRN
ncbi:acyl-CoA carboxylase epsilon subunit [Streptomyces sp. NPDC047081]|uniref:acyl-CoA carboxylase epsilon subunit n=1 Tax=Streptomyces sp. NPDC047081 TaxID=3154706 RepID=UPI0033E5AD6A